MRHVAELHGEGCVASLRAWVDGPEERRWAAEIGDISGALQADLESLARLLESAADDAV